jgi:Flp pilus assembly protein TadG
VSDFRAPFLPCRLANWLTARRERGSATIQMVVLMPALFTLMFLGVQAAVLYQGRTITLAAAQEGARVSAAADGSNAAGVAAASDFVSSTSAGLKNTSVSGNRTATTATITVTTHTVSLIPFVSPKITQSASMPVERLTG